MHRKLWIIILMLYILMSPMKAWAFSDVDEDHWATQSISVLASKGLVSGYGEGDFRPEASLTRAEAVVLLVNAKGVGQGLEELKNVECIFRDVEDGHWASAYINLAWERGLVSGYPDGSYRPEQQVSRLEFTTMLIRALEMEEYGGSPLAFIDGGEIPEWARTSVDLATSYRLISGYPDGTFKGNKDVRRDEATAMLGAFLKEVGVYYDFYGSLISYELDQIVFRVGGLDVQMTMSQELTERLGNDLVQDTQYLGVISQAGQLCHLEKVGVQELEQAIPYFLSTEIVGERQALIATLAATLSEREYEATDALRSSVLLREALGLNENYLGEGEIIAIIDSGIDPGISSLMKTPDGEEKLIGFYDVTDEGKIKRAGIVAKTERYVMVEGEQYDLQGIYTLSGKLPYGILDETRMEVDLDLNGRSDDALLVLFVDVNVKGIYDTLYIDTDHDYRFSDEEPMTEFVVNNERYNLNNSSIRGDLNVVISKISADGSEAVLGFDANGHGTAMACAASGYGEVLGTAPASKLLVIKAFNKSGQAEWRDIEEAIRLAVQKGATVVNLSMSYQDSVTSGNNSLTYLAQIYSERYGVVFIGAAGNLGPGTNTVATPGNGEAVLGVSGYIPGEYANEILGLPIGGDVIWTSSSNGPRDDGYVGIDVTAPALGILPTPSWDNAEYRLVEGTSVASALASGVIASFLSEDGRVEHDVKEREMIDIVRDSAILSDFDIYQTGGGILHYGGLDSWNMPAADISITTWNKELGVGQGLFGRNYTPGRLPIYVHQVGQENRMLYLKTDVSWVEPEASLMVLPKDGTRTVPLAFSVPEEPGIYYATLTVSVLPDLSQAEELHLAAIVPYIMQMSEEDMMYLELEPELGPGEIERIFVEVGAEASNLQATIHPRKKDIEYWFFDPAGRLMAQNNLDGSAIGTVNVENPLTGVWEIVVAGGLDNSLLSNPVADVRISLKALAGEPVSEPPQYNYFVGNITKTLSNNAKQWISLSLRDNAFRPLNGITVEIEGELFEVVDGWVRVKADRNRLQKIADGTIDIRF